MSECENKIAPLAIKFFLLNQKSRENKIGPYEIPYEIPIEWCAVSYWTWRKFEFLTITFIENKKAENAYFNFDINETLFAEAKYNPHMRDEIYQHMRTELFETALNMDEVMRRTHIMGNVYDKNDYHYNFEIYNFLCDQIIKMRPMSEEFNNVNQTSLMIEHLQSIPQNTRVIVKEKITPDNSIVPGCEYFANELFSFNTNGGLISDAVVVWDDNEQPHFCTLSSVVLMEDDSEISKNDEIFNPFLLK